MLRGTFVLLILISFKSMANHPSEGNISIADLINEAVKSNLELKAIEKEMNVANTQVMQTTSLFWPEFSLEWEQIQDNVFFQNQKPDRNFYSGNISWNLYRGGKDKHLLSYNKKQAFYESFKFLKSKFKVERDVTKKYYELLYIEESTALKNEALSVNKTQLDMALKKKRAGLTSQVDVLEFELRESTLESDINFLKQQKIQIENELLLLLSTNDQKFLKIHGHLEKESRSFSKEDLIKRAFNERLEIKQAENDKHLSEIKYDFTKSDFFPRIDLEGKYGKLFFEGGESGLQPNNSYLISLKLTLPFFSGLSTVRALALQEQETLRADHLLRFRIQETENQITRLLNQIETIKKRLLIEEKNIERSRRYFEITQSEYKRGIKNSPDLAGASERFFDSRIRNLEYRKNYYLTKIELAEILSISPSDLN